MRNLKRIFIIFTLIMFHSFSSFASGDRDGGTSQKDTQKIEHTGITSVKIDINSNLNINITGTEKPELFGEIQSENLRLYNINTELYDNELKINISSRKWMFFHRFDNNDIFLKVPVNTELYIYTENSNIIINNCNGKKYISIENGDLCIINSSGNIFADNENGDLIFGNITGDIDADSETGNILIYNSKGMLNLKTEKGKLEGALILLTKDSEFLTETGLISFNLLNSLSDFSYALDTETGLIMLDTVQGTGKYYSNTGLIKIHAATETGDIIFK